MQTATAEKTKTTEGPQVASSANVPAMAPSKPSLIAKMAARFGVDPDKLMVTLKATAFRQRPDKRTNEVREPTIEEMMALLIIADQYGLNPFTRELYAFLDVKSGAIVPIVSVDGWIRIINDRKELRSISFTQSEETVLHKGKTCHVWMECEIVRSDRDKPIVIREYFAEVVRITDYASPWDTHPNRFHRHKTLIQTARVAFGFAGIYDEDEAGRIIEGEHARIPDQPAAIATINKTVAGAKPVIEATASKAAEGSTVATTDALPQNGAPVSVVMAADAAPTYAEISDRINKAKSEDDVDTALALIHPGLPEQQRKELADLGRARKIELSA